MTCFMSFEEVIQLQGRKKTFVSVHYFSSRSIFEILWFHFLFPEEQYNFMELLQ